MVFDAINLRFGPARNETDALQHVAAREVRGYHRRETFTHQELHDELLERELQDGGFFFEEVKAVASDASAAFEIDEIVLLGECDVVLHREAEGSDIDLAMPQFLAGVFAADGCLRMREIRHRVVD